MNLIRSTMIPVAVGALLINSAAAASDRSGLATAKMPSAGNPIQPAMGTMLMTAAAPPTSQTTPPAPKQEPMAANDPEFMKIFGEQYDKTFADGAVPAKYKELAAAVLSIALKCEGCLKYHIKMAISHGATRREIVEILRIGLVAGGSAGIPSMRVAYTEMDEAGLK